MMADGNYAFQLIQSATVNAVCKLASLNRRERNVELVNTYKLSHPVWASNDLLKDYKVLVDMYPENA